MNARIVSLLAIISAASYAQAESKVLVLDDFQGSVPWQAFSDRVMGGRSEVASSMTSVEGRRALEMSGRVSTANNGGFIQVRLDLSRGGAPLDARAYTGVRLLVRGSGPGYYLHIRTSETILPWQYYSAPIALSGNWQTVELPFSDFAPQALGRKLNQGRIKSLAFVAAKGDFQALAYLGGVWLYEAARERVNP